MSTADTFRRLADGFTARVEGTTDWDAPAPCEGWVARDVVRHLVDWVPGFFGERWGIAFDPPPVDDDPAGAWHALDGALRAALAGDGSTVAETPFGPRTLEETIGQIVTGDVLVHTWDLARASGGDERLDPGAVHRLLDGMEAMGDAMRASGHFGPAVEVAPDADEQTRLIAFTGRRP